jgi:hypothetical protein
MCRSKFLLASVFERPARVFSCFLPDIAVDKAPVNRIQYAQFQNWDLDLSEPGCLKIHLFSEPPREPVATTEAQFFHGGER